MNHFSRFNLPCTFALDANLLEKTYEQLQRLTHPDRFAAASAAEQRLALQRASQINQAYDILRQPLTRAQYLCELQGIQFDSTNQPRLSAEFLAQQWEWRETLEAIDALQDATLAATQRQVFAQQLKTQQTYIATRFEQAYQAQDYLTAAQCVQEWKFIDKLTHQHQTNSRA